MDYMGHRNPDGKVNNKAAKDTQEIFLSWGGFVRQLKSNFGDVDARRNAVRALEALKQKGSAVS
ncbi:hypothetical protein GMDG_08925, partial [Pseudogymnoascus destructans 20631-21]